MKSTKSLTTTKIIAKSFGSTPRNIHKTYKAKKPNSFRVLEVGSYMMEHNVTNEEIEAAVDFILKMREIYGK